jgi:hypothetical protein
MVMVQTGSATLQSWNPSWPYWDSRGSRLLRGLLWVLDTGQAQERVLGQQQGKKSPARNEAAYTRVARKSWPDDAGCGFLRS